MTREFPSIVCELGEVVREQLRDTTRNIIVRGGVKNVSGFIIVDGKYTRSVTRFTK